MARSIPERLDRSPSGGVTTVAPGSTDKSSTMIESADNIFEELSKDQTDRKRITVYVSESMYERFRQVCEADPRGVKPNRVLEHLMERFINLAESESAAKRPKDKK